MKTHLITTAAAPITSGGYSAAFGAPAGASTNPVRADQYKRYGVKLAPSERQWETFDPRFDTAATTNEVNRFGYIVEVNPWDPVSPPIKHSAMGRLKNEGATIYVTPDGTVASYTGDEERFDYMYKFMSSKKIQQDDMAHKLTILDEGTLYVGKLSSGTGTWLPLLRSGPNGQAESLVAGMTAQEAAVFTRIAADKAGATKMDRPEDFEANPKTGKRCTSR